MAQLVTFYTFGCRLNQAETAAIRQDFKRRGFIETDCVNPVPDVVVINTCTVTENGDADTNQLVNRISRTYPQSRIALIGCQAQAQADKLSSLPNVAWVVGNARKYELAEIIKSTANPSNLTPSTAIHLDPLPTSNFTVPAISMDPHHTRANLKVQDGCDFYCFFCVIPYTRGRARSRVFADLMDEAGQLAAAGYKELILTGVNIGTYDDENRNLSQVVTTLRSIPGLRRIRISSIEPTTVPESLILQMRATDVSCRLCRYLHLPMQSGCDPILYQMNRRYTVAEYNKFAQFSLNHIAGLCLGTDIIVGYPGESDAYFDETYDTLDSLPFAYFHVFSYSHRDQAKSRKFNDHVPRDVIRKRSKILRRLSTHKRHQFMNEFLGTTQEVLFEQEKDDYWIGLTDNYLRVRVKSSLHLRNELIPVELRQIADQEMMGEIR